MTAAPGHPHRRRDLAWLALGGLLLFGVALGARDLWNPNEPTYGRVVVEMVEGRDWLVPRLQGEPFVEKPILYYWLAAATSCLAGGVSEATLRLPVMLASLASLLLTYVLVESYDGRRRALLASAAFATLYGVWFTARNAQMDSFVLLATLGAVLPLARRLDGGWSGRGAWLAAGVAMGLGFAAKGPVAVVVPASIVGAYALAARRPWRRLLPGSALGVLAAVALACPWYVALYLAGRGDALRELLLRQNVSRFLEAWDHVQPWWYYVKYFWLTFAPWSWFVPVAALAALRRRSDGQERPLSASLPWVWVLVPLLFFSLSQSKREPYMLPAAPAVAWLAASVLDAWRRRELSRGLAAACAAVAAALGLTLVATGVWVVWPGTVGSSPVAVSAVRPATVTLVGGGLVLAALLVHRRRQLVPGAVFCAFVGLYTLVAVYLHPLANAIKSQRPVVVELRRHLPPGHSLYSFFGPRWFLRGGYAYYLGQSLPDLKDAASLQAAWAAGEAPCVVTEGEEQEPEVRRLPDAEMAFAGEVGGRMVRLVCRTGPPAASATSGASS
jgi:4-amino-4-deoxy-L-arabinose transferase-like glycosyltransferase